MTGGDQPEERATRKESRSINGLTVGRVPSAFVFGAQVCDIAEIGPCPPDFDAVTVEHQRRASTSFVLCDAHRKRSRPRRQSVAPPERLVAAVRLSGTGGGATRWVPWWVGGPTHHGTTYNWFSLNAHIPRPWVAT